MLFVIRVVTDYPCEVNSDLRWLIHGDTEGSDDTLGDCVKEYHKYK